MNQTTVATTTAPIPRSPRQPYWSATIAWDQKTRALLDSQGSSDKSASISPRSNWKPRSSPRSKRLTPLKQHRHQPIGMDGPIRTMYLIRHGESQGQRASRKDRKTSERLLDCDLTAAGRAQAQMIPILLEEDGAKIQLVVTSPLTRAIHTTLQAFPTAANGEGIPIFMGYDLREIGSDIPENRPRKFKEIWRDLQVDDWTLKRMDLESLRLDTDFGEAWPRRHDTLPKVVRKDRIRNVFVWLARNLPPEITTLAVVCHFNVIRTALSDPYHAEGTHVNPINAQPIRCNLHPNGGVELIRVLGEEITPAGSSDEPVAMEL